MDQNARHMERIRERNYDQNAWNGFEKRNPQFKWYRIITDELRALKVEVRSLAGLEATVHELEKTIYSLYESIEENGD